MGSRHNRTSEPSSIGIAMQRGKAGTSMRQLLDALQVYEPERVYVFGSWARGEADELSDLDIVVIKRTTVPFFERLREVSRLLPAGTGAVDILVYTPEEFAAMLQEGNAFAEMIAEEARLLYVQQTES